MPTIDISLTLNDPEVCIALFDGTLENNNVIVQQTTYDVTIHSVPFSLAPGGRYLKFNNATPGTIINLRWDTPQPFLAYQANANGGSSLLSIASGQPFPILASACPGDPSLLKYADVSRSALEGE